MSVNAEAAALKLDRLKREGLISDRTRSESNSAAARIWREAKRSLGLGVVLFLLSGAVVLLCFVNLPDVQLSGKLPQILPRTIEQTVDLRDWVVSYSEKNLTRVLICICLLYIYMQSFAIPGTLTLSLMAGALLGVSKGLLLVSAISTVGSCSCYGVSKLLGSQLAGAIWPERLASFQSEVEKQRGNIFNYILFLRLTPILPNTFINMASPIVHVPLSTFMLGTMIGCIPNNFLAVNAGCKLKEMTSLNELYDLKLIAISFAVGIVAMLPILLKQRGGKKSAENKKTG